MFEPDELLEALLAAGTDAGLLMGDNVAPEEGGWVDGQPQSGLFRPYSVLMLGQSSPSEDLCEPSEWRVQFSLRHYGGSRRQLSAQANRARIEMILPWVGTSYVSMHSHLPSLGSVQRVDSVDPPYWQIYDALEVRAARR